MPAVNLGWSKYDCIAGAEIRSVNEGCNPGCGRDSYSLGGTSPSLLFGVVSALEPPLPPRPSLGPTNQALPSYGCVTRSSEGIMPRPTRLGPRPRVLFT